jgi:hypothetical protein
MLRRGGRTCLAGFLVLENRATDRSGLGESSPGPMFVSIDLSLKYWLSTRNIENSRDPNSFVLAGNRPEGDSKPGEVDSRPVPQDSKTRKVDNRGLMRVRRVGEILPRRRVPRRSEGGGTHGRARPQHQWQLREIHPRPRCECRAHRTPGQALPLKTGSKRVSAEVETIADARRLVLAAEFLRGNTRGQRHYESHPCGPRSPPRHWGSSLRVAGEQRPRFDIMPPALMVGLPKSAHLRQRAKRERQGAPISHSKTRRSALLMTG